MCLGSLVFARGKQKENYENSMAGNADKDGLSLFGVGEWVGGVVVLVG